MEVYLNKSGNKRIFYWIKKSSYLAFFPTQTCEICYSCTFFYHFVLAAYVIFWTQSCPILHLFLQQRTLLVQKLLYFFKFVKFNLIFYFLQLMQALTLYVPRKMQHPPNFLIPIFDYQVTFKKYTMYRSRMYWSHDLKIYYLIIWRSNCITI